MLQSFALRNSSLNFKSTKHDNVIRFINVKGTSIHSNEFQLKNLRIFKVCFNIYKNYRAENIPLNDTS